MLVISLQSRNAHLSRQQGRNPSTQLCCHSYSLASLEGVCCSLHSPYKDLFGHTMLKLPAFQSREITANRVGCPPKAAMYLAIHQSR